MEHMLITGAILVLIALIKPAYCEDIVLNELDMNKVESNVHIDQAKPINPKELDESVQEVYKKLLKAQQGGQLVTRREHLKKDWCKAEPLVHKIRDAGCIPNTVVNRFCYGQCNSFYIPGRSGRRRRSEVDFRSCAACRPSLANWITVNLSCPGGNPPHKTRRVYRVKRCKCVAHDFL
ncbi:gremlin-2-like [Rhodnius prolixus]